MDQDNRTYGAGRPHVDVRVVPKKTAQQSIYPQHIESLCTQSLYGPSPWKIAGLQQNRSIPTCHIYDACCSLHCTIKRETLEYGLYGTSFTALRP